MMWWKIGEKVQLCCDPTITGAKGELNDPSNEDGWTSTLVYTTLRDRIGDTMAEWQLDIVRE